MDREDAIINGVFLTRTISELPEEDREFILAHLTGAPIDRPQPYVRLRLKQVTHALAVLGGAERTCNRCDETLPAEQFSYDRRECISCEPVYARHARSQNERWMAAIEESARWQCAKCGERKTADAYDVRERWRCKECLRGKPSKAKKEAVTVEKEVRKPRKKQGRTPPPPLSDEERQRLSECLARQNQIWKERRQKKRAKGAKPKKKEKEKEKEKSVRRSKQRKPRELKPCGTRASYTRGCRCNDCRNANSEAMRAYYERKRAKEATRRKPRELKPCGTRAAFKRGCRCEDCKEAERAYRKDLRARRQKERKKDCGSGGGRET